MALLVGVIVGACGSGGPVASGAPAASQPGGGGGGGGGTAGEPYDEAKVLSAADALAATDSYVYDASIVQTGGSGTRAQAVHGVVRSKPAVARSVGYTADGSTITLLFVDGVDYADYGNGITEVNAEAGTRDDTDPLSIKNLYATAVAGVGDDFVVAGNENTHGVEAVHLVLDPEVLADRRDSLGAGNEGWVAELWLAVADGRLVKLIWGGPQAAPPAAFGQPYFTIDVTEVNCTCPVDKP